MNNYLKDIAGQLTTSPEKNIRLLLSFINNRLNGSLACYFSEDLRTSICAENYQISENELSHILNEESKIFESGLLYNSYETNELEMDEKIVKLFPLLVAIPGKSISGKSFSIIVFYKEEIQIKLPDFDDIYQILVLIALETQHLISKSENAYSKDIYKAVFENANDTILLLKDTDIVNCNSKGCELFGYSVDEIIGKTIYELSPKEGSTDHDLNLNKKGYLKKALAGEPQRFDWIHEKKDGTAIYTEITLKRISGSHEFNALSIIRDITQRMKYEQLLKEQKEKASETSRLKSLSLASMSHELRTPLNSIIGFSDLLLDEDTTEEEKEMFSRLIQTAGKSLMQLIGDIIDISKIEAGKVNIQKSIFKVNSFLQEIYMTFLQEKKSRNADNVELKLMLSDKASELRLKTDEHRLRQVFNNLLTNSLKFVDDGFIEFGYFTITPDFIQFYVKDTGVGIDYEQRSNIFEQFGQDKSTYSRNKEGSGLGLAISRSFVEMLGGTIWLDSEPEKGSTFYFTIPFENKLSVLTGIGIHNAHWKNNNILVVDDVKENYLFINGLLNHTEANILWAKDGKEAYDICVENGNINCVLMDIRMPVMDGFESAALIKKDFPDMVIIAQTAFASDEDREKCLSSGFDYYFRKPLNFNDLFDVLLDCFNE